jgi:NAD(P)-dependent dehydrogenase (short-subunit alcohol dehydrogenase family)
MPADSTPRARVLVTGAAGALGGSVVRRFVAAGDRVLAVDVDAGRLEELAAAAPAGAVAVLGADLTDPAAVAAVFDAAEADGGTPPAVAHLVGGFRWAKLADMDDRDWELLWRVNVGTTFCVCREASRRFAAAGGGALVAVSAPAALLGEAGVGAYAATKAAVLRLVESLAREMAPFGGRANAVLPGTMDTPDNRRAMADADPAGWVSTDDVAAVIHQLTTPAARAVNGAAVRVPGPDL